MTGNLARASALEGEFAELQARQSRKFSVGFLLPNVVYVATYSVLYPSFNKLPVAGAGLIIVAHVCVLLRFAYPRGAWLPSPPTGHALLLVAISMVIAFTHPEVQYHFAPTFQIYEALGKRPVCADDNPDLVLKFKDHCRIRDAHYATMMLQFIILYFNVFILRWRHALATFVPAVVGYSTVVLCFGKFEGNYREAEFILFACSACLSVGAKWAVEEAQRRLYCELKCEVVRERVLRCEAEFRSEHDEANVIGAPASNSSEDGCSGQESVPSTSESGRAFTAHLAGRGNQEFLQAIASIGQKEQWLIGLSELSLMPGRVLGEGGFGRVLAGLYQGIPVAVKEPKASTRNVRSTSHLVALCNELRILRRLRHPNIVFLYGACLEAQRSKLSLVLELVDGTSLREFILVRIPDARNGPDAGSSKAPRAPSDIHRSQVLVDVACALRYLHTRQPHIVHGDLKDSNIFVDCRSATLAYHAKLLDFGLSRLITRHAKPLSGTIRWMAPELLQGRDVAPRTGADVFSFGRLTYFVVTGRYPCRSMNREEYLQTLRDLQYKALEWPLNNPLVARYRLLAEQCSYFAAELRPSISEVHEQLVPWLLELLQSSSAEASNSNRPLDLILHGATGVSGSGHGHRAVRRERLPMVPEEDGNNARSIGNTSAIGIAARGMLQEHEPGVAAVLEGRGPTTALGTADDIPSGQRVGHNTWVRLNSSKLMLSGFQETPTWTVHQSLHGVMRQCNLRGRACCMLHLRLAHISKAVNEMYWNACTDDARPFNGWQCRYCWAMNVLPSFSDEEPYCLLCEHVPSGAEAGSLESEGRPDAEGLLQI